MFALTCNLAALFYYKYAFALTAWLADRGVGHHAWAEGVLLPLGISFFTFTQIGFLLDSKDGAVKHGSLLNYILFVTFFPHLIAGPILHHKEIMPQFEHDATYRFNGDNFGRGYSLFMIGMLKKVLIADSFSDFASDGFGSAQSLSLFGAWGTVLCYSLQLYFDFSGYSDMAVGIAKMINIQFPLNFNSPYQATNIIDFWARWHMTLTRYINQYLYNPLALFATRRLAARGGPINNKALAKPGPFLRVVVVPICVTMCLAGVWHGAGMQFLIFGMLHAFYIVCNRTWRTFGPKLQVHDSHSWRSAFMTVGSIALTYLCVLIGDVFFRAPSMGAAINMLAGMLGQHGMGVAFPVPHGLPALLGSSGTWLVDHNMIAPVDPAKDGTIAARTCIELFLAYLIIWLCPNSQTIVGLTEASVRQKIRAQPAGARISLSLGMGGGVLIGLVTAAAILEIGAQSEFLYFQF